MAACSPSIHVFLGRPLFLLSSRIHSIINFCILSSDILLTWSYHCSLFFPMMSVMFHFPFTPIIFFICSFRFLSILETTNPRCVKCLKSQDTIYTTVLASNHPNNTLPYNISDFIKTSKILTVCCYSVTLSGTDTRRLTAGILSKKCVVRRFRRCANVTECIYTNLDSTVYPTAHLGYMV